MIYFCIISYSYADTAKDESPLSPITYPHRLNVGFNTNQYKEVSSNTGVEDEKAENLENLRCLKENRELSWIRIKSHSQRKSRQLDTRFQCWE